jgi:hypothetical protein
MAAFGAGWKPTLLTSEGEATQQGMHYLRESARPLKRPCPRLGRTG